MRTMRFPIPSDIEQRASAALGSASKRGIQNHHGYHAEHEMSDDNACLKDIEYG